MKCIRFKVCLALLMLVIFAGTTWASAPKYVFYFIGDGMASPQIHATEAYLASLSEADEVEGGVKEVRLNITQLPVLGMQTTYASDRFITDSAAAGTALACGKKTNCGVIAMDATGSISYKSIAEAAKEIGMKVGIISSVSIDHATPAVFYAHQASRNNYLMIGAELVQSDFDYFAGGGFRVNKWNDDTYGPLSDDESWEELEKVAVEDFGFTFTNTRTEFDALTSDSGRVIAVNPYLDSSNAIPYAINRLNNPSYDGSITLAEFTQKGIDLMAGNSAGFFMMVEGGKIDWACHANDAMATIQDTIAFDDAVKVAIDFAEQYPDETLIVITGDHECGGMTLGYVATAYDSYYEKLANQTMAYDDFDSLVDDHIAAYGDTIPADIDDGLWTMMETYFGLHKSDLSDYEIGLLEDAFDKEVNGTSEHTSDEDYVIYGGYSPISVTVTHVLNRQSGLSFSSSSHTAVPVPVYASGTGSSTFSGYYDNTDIAKKLAEVMGVTLD